MHREHKESVMKATSVCHGRGTSSAAGLSRRLAGASRARPYLPHHERQRTRPWPRSHLARRSRFGGC